MDINGSFSIMWLSSQGERSQKSASLGKLLAILVSLPSSVSSTSTTVLISSGLKSQSESALSKSELAGSAAAGSAAAGLAAAASSPAVVAAAASILKLSIPPNTTSKSRYRSDGGEKREGAGDSNNNVPASSGGLFAEGFRKYSSGGNVLNAIKGATRLVCLFSVVGMAVLGSRGKLTPRAVRFCKYYNIS